MATGVEGPECIGAGGEVLQNLVLAGSASHGQRVLASAPKIGHGRVSIGELAALQLES